MKHTVLAATMLAAALGAQSTTYTAHPIDNLNSSTAQNIPLAGNSTSWDEARTQFLFLAPFLPTTGGLITAIEWVANTSYATPYERFEIYMDHTPNTTLSTTFANNLTAPQLVYSRSPGVVNWVGAAWTQIVLDTPFAYDGQSNLVVEVRKKMDRPNNPPTTTVNHRILVYPRRADLPVPIWTNGAYGSGAVDGPTATTTYSTQILTRLVWLGTPTTTIDSTRDPTGNASRSYFHLGATMTVTTQGTPSDLFVQAIDLMPLLPTGVSAPGLLGEVWLTAPVLFGLGLLDAGGRGSISLTIPNDQGLIGLHPHVQSATVSGSTIAIANVVDAPVAAF